MSLDWEEAEPTGRSRSVVVLVVLMAAAVALIPVVFVSGLAAWRAARAPTDPATAAVDFEARTGIHIERVAATAGGGLVDVRFRALDPTVAAETFESLAHPILIDEATGTRLARPWMGHAGHPSLRAGVISFVLLENPGRVVTPGQLVTVVAGGYQLEHVRVA